MTIIFSKAYLTEEKGGVYEIFLNTILYRSSKPFANGCRHDICFLLFQCICK